MTAAKEVSVGVPDETALLRELAEAMRRVRRGDLKVRLPRRGGFAGEVADVFNEVASLQERQNLDLRRISRIVGRRLPRERVRALAAVRPADVDVGAQDTIQPCGPIRAAGAIRTTGW